MSNTPETSAPTESAIPAQTAVPAAASPEVLFRDFGLDARIQAAIDAIGYLRPTPIQAQAIPLVLAGRDVMGAAQTGTGKTAAFTLPILQQLVAHESTSTSPARHPVRALILAPTRELADQISVNVTQYAAKTALRSTVVFGGIDMNPQTEALRRGVEILIATPGRLLDHVQSKNVALGQVSILVLDEADRMLDMGFLPDLQRIVNLLPKQRQTLLFSATFSPEIRKLAASFQKNPVTVEVARQNATATNITQRIYAVSEDDKRSCLVDLLRAEDPRQVIVFSNSKLETGRLARFLEKEGFAADAIHGDKSQNERLAALQAFKDGKVEVLVATDVAARGLDIAELPCVINFDVPFNPEDYVHRIGRTGRAGMHGRALTLVTPGDSRNFAQIEKLINRAVEVATWTPSRPRRVREDGVGERSDRGERPSRERETGRDSSREGARSRSEAYGGRSSYTPRPAPVDPFFTQPYEPSAPAEGAESPAPAGTGTKTGVTRGRRPVAALLGGRKS